MKNIITTLFFLSTTCFCDVLSTDGKIRFDTQMDGQAEMTLNSTGLGIGTLPSSNLHVNGNAIISEQLFVGGSSGSSNLNVNGTIGYGIQTVSSNTTLGETSIVFVDSSSDNITLTLPYAGNVSGRIYNIKKTSLLNSVWILGAGNLIDDTNVIELPESNSLASVKLLCDGIQWYKIQQKDIAETVASDNLVGWWKLDEASGFSSFTDSGENSVTGSLNNGHTFSGRQGLLNGALDIPAGVAYGTVSDDPIFDLSTFSISLWAQRDTDSGGYEVICSKFNGTGNQREWLVGFRDNDIPYFQVSNNGSASTLLMAATTIATSTWVHLVGTFDGNNMKIYVNGILENTDTSAGVFNSTTDVAFGSANAGGNRNFVGLIDDVKIYNRALTSSEIQALYNQGQ